MYVLSNMLLDCLLSCHNHSAASGGKSTERGECGWWMKRGMV